MSRATLKTIAELTGLSITTVSRALKDGPEVKPATKNRVKEIAAELGYRPNTSGISLKTGQTFDIALIVPVIKPGDVIGDIGTLPLIEGLTAGLDETEYHLTVIPHNPGEPGINPVRYVVEKGLADGIILTSTRVDDDRVKYLTEKNVPFVTFGRTEMATPHAWYDVDNADFAYNAARYLFAKGRRNLVLVTPDPKYLFGWHRIIGFRRAAMEFGVTLDDEKNIVFETNTDEHRKFVQQASTWDSPPDGYICSTEITALAISSTLQNIGIVSGENVDVITMEASRLAEFYHPPLTAFTQDLHHAGRQLSALLLRAINGEDVKNLHILDKVKITERR